eukprot:s1514_g21.t1
MQKGVAGVKQVLEAMMDGLGLTNGQPMMLIDFLPTRQEWWDNSAEAGQKSRPAVPFATPRPTLDILTVVGAELKCWKGVPANLQLIARIPDAVADAVRSGDPAIIRMFEDVQVKVKTWNDTCSEVGSTSCRPVFSPGEVVELGRTHVFSEDCVMTMEALEADHQLLDVGS